MAKNTNAAARPRPIFSYGDHDKLTQLAEGAMRRDPFLAQALLDELDRAEVVDEASVPSGVVRVGSVVEFTVDGHRRRGTIVFPIDADIDSGKLSIMTPIAAALIGLAEDQAIEWKTRDGKTLAIVIGSVENAHETRMEVA
jgi:regulator of nucleoside diphosphate kinase